MDVFIIVQINDAFTIGSWVMTLLLYGAHPILYNECLFSEVRIQKASWRQVERGTTSSTSPSPIYSLINLSRNTHFTHPCPRGKDLKLPFSSFKSIGGKNPSYDFIYLHNNITAERKLHNENKLLVIFWCLKEVKIQERLEFPWKLLALGNSTKPC